jgi:transcriptional regulator with XRE-family HTH domain
MVDKNVGKFANRLQQAMENNNVSVKDLCEMIDMTYEHTRKIAKGLVVPSKNMAGIIAEAMKLPKRELQELAMEDKLLAKFGGVASKMAGRNPELEPIDAVWGIFDENDKREIYQYVQMRADMKKQRKVARRA